MKGLTRPKDDATLSAASVGSPVPYYDKDGITIYCGDAHDILPGLHCEVTITDPPYMIGAHSTGTE
jgi:hypothetical protein